MTTKTKIVFLYSGALIGIVIWLGVIFLAPWLHSRLPSFSRFLYAVFSPTCHQIPSRCFYAFGSPLGVCARCLGIYLGCLLGTLTVPVLKGLARFDMPRAKTFLFISIPIVVDTAGNFFRIWISPNWMRLASGIIWGIILPFYVLAGITDLLVRKTETPFEEQPIESPKGTKNI